MPYLSRRKFYKIMRKIVLGLSVLAMVSCGSGEEEPKNELESQEKTAENLEENKVYDVVDYNDGLLAEVTLLDVKFAQLIDFDNKNVSQEEMSIAIEEALAEQVKVMDALEKVTPFGVNGLEFKEAAIRYATDIKDMFDLYKEFEDKFQIPDEEWTEEDATVWYEKYQAAYEKYAAAHENFGTVQENYASRNNMTLEYDVDPEAIYEESINESESALK